MERRGTEIWGAEQKMERRGKEVWAAAPLRHAREVDSVLSSPFRFCQPRAARTEALGTGHHDLRSELCLELVIPLLLASPCVKQAARGSALLLECHSVVVAPAALMRYCNMFMRGVGAGAATDYSVLVSDSLGHEE